MRCLVLLLLAACGSPVPQQRPLQVPATELSEYERRAGWELLFDGSTTRGWRGVSDPGFPERGWRLEDGALVHAAGGGGGDLVTERTFRNFELELEWQLAEGANSGVKYRVTPGTSLGPEFQLLDDGAHDVDAKHRTGSLYDLAAPAEPAERPAGPWHHTRIVARGPLLEHWLDGRRVVRVRVDDEAWHEAHGLSKFAHLPAFGHEAEGHVLLQDHGDEVRYRNIRIRDLDRLPGREVELFDGRTLEGWRELGDAIYEPDQGSILGRIGGGGQSFLVTEEAYSDFLLTLELRAELPGNSGVQVRSHVNDAGRLYGYQIEIDSSERAWSGGLYDEGRRGWLDDLSDNEAGRAAFRPREWNRYEIHCIGRRVRAWVNGVPTADWTEPEDDPETLSGIIGLQVHSGNDTRVRWRGLVLRDLTAN